MIFSRKLVLVLAGFSWGVPVGIVSQFVDPLGISKVVGLGLLFFALSGVVLVMFKNLEKEG